MIIGHSQFEKIPMSVERQQAMLERQIDELVMGIAEVKENKGEKFTIKQMEKSRKNLETKLAKITDQSRKDDVVTFEELGVKEARRSRKDVKQATNSARDTVDARKSARGAKDTANDIKKATNGVKDTAKADHVGIVEYVEADVVYTVEGNSSDSCRRRSYSINSNVIVDYGTPSY